MHNLSVECRPENEFRTNRMDNLKGTIRPMNQKLATLWLGAFFALAWLPFGQLPFMEDHWMKIGAYIAPFLLFMAFKARASSQSDGPLMTDSFVVACALAAAYLVHQVEEHWVDLLGRPYPLYELLNSLIAQAFGEEKYGVMTPRALFYVNAGTVWTLAFTAILASPKHVFPAVAMAGLMIVNGAAHIVVAGAQTSYNPGLATSIVLFLPLALAFYRALLGAHGATPIMLGAGIAYGVVGHVLLFAGLFAANVFGLIPISLYYTILIVYGLLPLALFRSQAAVAA
ncbi:MAG: HXXEE domain-containing protein [Pseudomonadota bacterium]